MVDKFHIYAAETSSKYYWDYVLRAMIYHVLK